MYGKLFADIYNGSLHGHWEAIVTLQQLVILADRDGLVDMAPSAISARTSIPLKHVKAGLEHLAKPDPHSRTPGEEGRRIALIDPSRPWGWRIVNYVHYRTLHNAQERRERQAARMREARAGAQPAAQTDEPTPSTNGKKGKTPTKPRAPTPTCAHVRSRAQPCALCAQAEVEVEAKEEGQKLARSDAGADQGAAVILLPCNQGDAYPIGAELVKELGGLYQAVNVEAELRKMRGWLLCNPKNRKTRAGMLRFVNNWLAQHQDKAPGKGKAPTGRRAGVDSSYAGRGLYGRGAH